MSEGREVRAIGQAGWRRTLGAGIVSLIYFFPVYFILMTAFKTRPDALAMPIKFFFSPTLDNFYSVFWRADIEGGGATNSGFGLYFFNSLFISGTSVTLALIIGTSAAYAFSRFPLRGNDTYLFIILTTRMLPPIIAIIPIFVLFRVFGLSGSYTGIIALYTAFNLPFSIWMVKSFFDDLDRDIEDAGRMDGSSEWSVFRKICLPQIYGGLAATFVFAVILTWNEFFIRALAHRHRDANGAGGHSPDHRRPGWRGLGAHVGDRDAVHHSRRSRHLPAAKSTAARRDVRHDQKMKLRTWMRFGSTD